MVVEVVMDEQMKRRLLKENEKNEKNEKNENKSVLAVAARGQQHGMKAKTRGRAKDAQ